MNPSRTLAPRRAGLFPRVRLAGALLTAGLLSAAVDLHAQCTPTNITLSVVIASGSDWNTAKKWSDQNPASVSAGANPCDTYECLPGSRLRSPNGATYAMFPGVLLTMDGNSVHVNGNSGNPSGVGEIRFKQGANTGGSLSMDYGTNYFNKLVMNGGQLDLGNDGTCVIDGELNIAAPSSMYNDGPNDRGYVVIGKLTGSARLEWWAVQNGLFTPSYFHNLNIAGNNNTFSGTWYVHDGVLVGTGTNALGTNTITIDSQGALLTTYNINNRNGNLILNGQMFLTQDDTFQSVIINGVGLTKGTHSFAELSASFTNFPATWAAYQGVESYTAGSGSITVLANNTTPVSFLSTPANQRVLTNTTATFAAAVSGPAQSIQWYSNNVALAGATNLTYTAGPVDPAYNNAVYKIVVANNINSVNASATLTIGNAVLVPGFVNRSVWIGTQYTRANTDGTTDVPSVTGVLTAFEDPINDNVNNFVDIVAGYFTPAVTTNYVFFVSSDDDTDLYLSTDNTPAGKNLIAQEPNWSNSRQWLSAASGGAAANSQKRSDQWSPDGGITVPWAAGIPLVAGTRYYIEAVHHQGTGGDNLAVTFSFSGDNDPANGSAPLLTGSLISGYFIDGGTVTITNAPKSGTLVEGHFTNLTVGVQASSPFVQYQWLRGGAAIPGATGTTYQTPVLFHATDDQAHYQVVASIPAGQTTTSAVATLTVLADTSPLLIAEAPGVVLNSLSTNNEIDLIFNKPITVATATNLANYQLSGATVLAADLVTNSSGLDKAWYGVVLTTSNLAAGTLYNLTVSGLHDIFGNVLAATNLPVTPSAFSWAAIGRSDWSADYYQSPFGNPTTIPVLPSRALAVGGRGFNLVNGGETFLNMDEDITFAYQLVQGNFDIAVQVQNLDPSVHSSVAGLMAREGIEPPGATRNFVPYRFQSIMVSPASDYTGTILPPFLPLWSRVTYGANMDDPIDQFGSFTTNYTKAAFPAVWLRMQRQLTDTNDVFVMSSSTNGTAWTILGDQNFVQNGDITTAMPTNLYVGVAYGAFIDQMGGVPAAFNVARDFAVRVRNFGPTGVLPVAVTLQNAGLTGPQLRFTFASQSGVSYVVEYKNALGGGSWTTLTTLPGTGGNLTVTDTAGSGKRFYRVRGQ